MCESMSKRIWGRSENISVSIELSKFKWSSTLLAITQVALRAAQGPVGYGHYTSHSTVNWIHLKKLHSFQCCVIIMNLKQKTRSTYYKGISLNTMFSCVNKILKIKMQDHSLKQRYHNRNAETHQVKHEERKDDFLCILNTDWNGNLKRNQKKKTFCFGISCNHELQKLITQVTKQKSMHIVL